MQCSPSDQEPHKCKAHEQKLKTNYVHSEYGEVDKER